MKKKIISLCLVIALAVTAVTGATLAYFTDADKDVNVMVSGNVNIVQNETDRNGKPYQNNQKLVPAVYNGTIAYDGTMKNTTGEGQLPIFDKTVENEIDKVISVTNKGTEPVFVRTILLIENTKDNAICSKLHFRLDNSDGQTLSFLKTADNMPILVKIRDTKYCIATATYNTALAPKATTAPSLMQVFVNPSADNEWSKLLGDGELSIIAMSQAVQSQGFADAATALNTAFGEVNVDNVAKWFADTGVETTGNDNEIK